MKSTNTPWRAPGPWRCDLYKPKANDRRQRPGALQRLAGTHILLHAFLIALLTSMPCRAETELAPELVQCKRETGVMGTELKIEVLATDQATGDKAIDAAIAEIQRIEYLMTDWRPSPLTTINNNAGVAPTPSPAELVQIISRSKEVSKLTEGAFDISFASAGHLWNFKNKTSPTLPDPAAIQAALQNVGFKKIKIDPEALTVSLPKKVKIGLGGIAKGYGIDRAMRVLLSHGIKHAVVNAGGDMKMLGQNEGTPWEIAIKHPRDRERAIASLRLSNTCIVTSGDYERFFELDGKRYHHIIDPRTGYPSTGAISVTVVAQSAEFADALATACCVLPHKKGMALIESLPKVEAIIVDMDGQVHVSTGLQEAVSPQP